MTAITAISNMLLLSPGDPIMYLPQRWDRSLCAIVLLSLFALQARAADTRFVITLPAGHSQEVTGRAFIIISKVENPELRLQAGSWRSRAELLGRDVQALQPGESTTMDSLAMGYPLKSVRELPAGDYYVQ